MARAPRRNRYVKSVGIISSLAIGALALPSCTAHDSQPSNSPSASGSVSDPRSKVVIKAYEAYWKALLAASDPANPADPQLSKVAIKPELDRAHQLLTVRRAAGEVVRGRYGHKEEVVAIADADAQLTDCLSTKISVLDAKTKKVKHAEPAGPFPVTVKLKLDGKSWKVADISAGTQSCISTAPPPIPSTSSSKK